MTGATVPIVVAEPGAQPSARLADLPDIITPFTAEQKATLEHLPIDLLKEIEKDFKNAIIERSATELGKAALFMSWLAKQGFTRIKSSLPLLEELTAEQKATAFTHVITILQRQHQPTDLFRIIEQYGNVVYRAFSPDDTWVGYLDRQEVLTRALPPILNPETLLALAKDATSTKESIARQGYHMMRLDHVIHSLNNTSNQGFCRRLLARLSLKYDDNHVLALEDFRTHGQVIESEMRAENLSVYGGQVPIPT